MAEIQRQQIRSLYGELKGINNSLPSMPNTPVPGSVAKHYNEAVSELNTVTGTNYSRHLLSDDDKWPYGDETDYDQNAVRTRVNSLVERLEQEHGFGTNSTALANSPVIVTVNQNQQVTISVTPIQQLIDSAQNDEIRKDLEELKDALSSNKEPKAVSGILDKLRKTSWEVFIKVLPLILEHWGQISH